MCSASTKCNDVISVFLGKQKTCGRQPAPVIALKHVLKEYDPENIKFRFTMSGIDSRLETQCG